MRRASIVLLVGLMLSACTAQASSSPEPPDGLSLSVYQNRTDVELRKLEVSFLNDTGSVLTITRLELQAGQFDGAAIWPKKSTTIPAGVTISLPVPLPEPDCKSAPTAASVEFDYALSDGRSGTAQAAPVDTLDRLPGIRADDCIAASVALIATLEFTTAPVTAMVGGRTFAEIDLTITPTGAAGSVELESASSTTLLSPVDTDGGDITTLQIGRTVLGTDSTSTMTLRYVPNRCDAHAIAEDKRGTVFPLAVTTGDGFEGRLYLSASDDVRERLYAFVRTACGLPTG